MLTVPIHPPAVEEAVGLGFYASRTPGVAGRLKGTPDDFVVSEISDYPLPDPSGPYTVLRVRSRDWEQHELASAIARRLGLAAHAVQWAGTKDRKAVAERLFSYRGPAPVRDLDLRGVEVLETYSAREGLVLGHHYGNAFAIRVEELDADPLNAAARYREVERELRAGFGIPNFFGLQRFGEVRPITAEVGRCVVRGDLAGAVDAYLTAPCPDGRPGPGDLARRRFAEHRDPVEALREFPAEYRFERTLLEHLARGHTPERAFRALSRELRLLFVHAFQSLLFNRWLTRRYGAGLPFDRPVPGDRLLRLQRDGTLRSQDAIPVADDNLNECADVVARGRALVAGPLVGFDTPVDPGPVGELFEEALSAEGVTRSQFRLPATPEIASRGAWRPIVVPVPPIALSTEEASVVFRFALPKGAYATVLLREFLKTGSSR